MAEGAALISRLARGGPHWLVFYALILAAWAVVWLMGSPAPDLPGLAALDPEFWRALCSVDPAESGFAPVAAMWGLMVVAMMLPSLMPALAVLEDLGHARAAGPRAMPLFVTGYLIVWGTLALLGAALQLQLSRAGLLGADGTLLSRAASAGLLALAGLYQFSSLKAACLSQCRAPLGFFLQHWAQGDRAMVAMGLRMGAVCAGCCWALMALAFVGGTMSLAFMGLATFIMFTEKLPGIGRWITRPLGVLLLLLAAGQLAGAF